MPSRYPRLVLAAWCCVCLLLVWTQPGSSRGVSISLRARWNGTSYLSEAAEFLADEDPSLFWRFLGLVHSEQGPSDTQQCWRHIIDQASSVAPAVAQVLPLALASRQYSPRLELFRQLRVLEHPGQSACCLVDINGLTASSVEEAEGLLASAHEGQGAQLVDVDHVYGGAGPSPVTAVLYGPLGAPCTAQLHTFLSSKAAPAVQGGLRYVYRPVLLASCAAGTSTSRAGPCDALGSEGALVLPGFGVEAVLKNMEYSAMDDKKVKAEQQEAKGADSSDAALGSLKGFEFDTLVSRKPHLRQELLTLRDHLSSQDDEEIKVWDLKDLGLQAAQRVIQAADPLALLTEISQNFPALVSSLSRQKVDEKLRTAVSANQQMVSPGGNFMLLNGLAFDIKEFELYPLLDRLRVEARLAGGLSQALKLPSDAVQRVLGMRGETSSEDMSDARLDLGSTAMSRHTIFFNNLEKDEMYRRFSDSVTEILNTYPGRLRPLAVNVFTLVAVTDPLSADGRALAPILYKLYSDYVPVRLGLAMAVTPAVQRAVTAVRYGPGAPGTASPAWSDMQASERFARAMLTIKAAFGGSAAFSFWVTVSQAEVSGGEDGVWWEELIKGAFQDNWALAAKSPATAKARMAAKKTGAQAWEQLQKGEGYSAEVGMELQESTAWLLSKGLVREQVPATPPSTPPTLVWVNGLLMPLEGVTSGVTDQEIFYKLASEQQRVQEAVYYGRITDRDDVSILDQVLQRHQLISRYNPKVLPPPSSDGGSDASAEAATQLSLASLLSHSAHTLLPALSFYQQPANPTAPNRIHAVTHFVVADPGSSEGRTLLVQALRFLLDLPASSKQARVVVVPNPADTRSPPTLGELLLMAVGDLQGASKQQAAQFLLSAYRSSSLSTALAALPPAVPLPSRLSDALKEAAVAVGLDGGALASALDARLSPDAASVQARRQLSSLAAEVFKLSAGDCAVISNGRLLLVHSPSKQIFEEVVAEDIQLLQVQASQYGTGSALAAEVQAMMEEGLIRLPGSTASPRKARKARRPQSVDGMDDDEDDDEDDDWLDDDGEEVGPWNATQQQWLDDVVLVAASEMAAVKYPEDRLPGSASRQLRQVMEHLREKASVKLPALGASAAGDGAGLQVQLILNPLSRVTQKLSQVLQLLRNTMGAAITIYLNPPRDLSDLPLKAFYRFALPEVTLDQIPSSPAAYLPHLPTKRVLTINLDAPEAWLLEPALSPYDLDNLRLADVPHGDVYAEYELEAVMLTGSCVDVSQGQGRGTPPRGLQLHLGTTAQPHMMDTLVMSNLAYFQLKAAPGRWLLSLAPGRTQELYAMDGAAAGASEREGQAADATTQVAIASLSGKHMMLRVRKRPGMEKEDVLQPAAGSEVSSAAPTNSTINVFTVASGHMYERLQKIMMLSVVQNTNRRVKFWVIKNYCSPHHRAILPQLAARYGFDIEFVTYKWPHWLHKQTDKQRIIWAYKILFLDVLFPLSVDRIIFVDSDQVVRADLGELYDMDIQGAPYAYTPFCDNNPEVNEFRFWKGGFWKDHLQGKPYHISALYLVDLKRFRALAAGDQLRIVYDQLSKDPNSLANLDQDLPNYAQHSIPIFSLPQEWLWCESWCGNATKAKARTIDLCNNPKTKEPKLQAARRILPEWEGLDKQQAELTKSIEDSLAADAAAADAAVVGGEVLGVEGGLPEAQVVEGAPAHDEL